MYRHAIFALFISATVVLAACNGSGSSSVAPPLGGSPSQSTQSIQSRSPSVVQAQTLSEGYVQSFSASTPGTTAVTSFTVPLGTSGTAGKAPSSADELIAIVAFSGTASGQFPSAPSGWTAVSNGAVTTTHWNNLSAYFLPPGTTIPASVTFADTNTGSMIVTIVEVSGASGAEAVAAGGVAATTTSANTPATTGSGTASAAGELQIVAAIMDDACYNTAYSLSGFTRLSIACQRGNGGSSYGGSSQVWYGSSLTTGTSIASTTMTFSGSSGNQTNAGLSILAKAAPGGSTPTPAPSTAPTTTPSPIPSGTYWSGTVSAFYATDMTANCGQTNFSQYGCIPVHTAGAVINGTRVVGQYFQLWGDLSKLPNVTAYTINYGATAFPVTAPTAGPTAGPTPTRTASPAPTATPTAKPTAPPSSGPLFPNGYPLPLSFTPYKDSVVWSTQLPTNPKLIGNSAAVISSMFPADGSSGRDQGLRNSPAGAFDASHPLYFASTSDPLITITCTQSFWQQCGNVPGGLPAQMYIPNKALAGQSNGGDSHLTVVQPPNDPNTAYANHTESFYVWRGNGPSLIDPKNSGGWGQNGNTSIGGGSVAELDCGNFITGTGLAPLTTLNGGQIYGGTAGNACHAAGMTRPNQLAAGAGAIHHALFLTAQCQTGATVYPASPYLSMGQCTGGVGPNLGARFWSDIPCSTIAVMPGLTNPERAILCALNQYGGYIMDSGSGTGNITGTGIGLVSTGSLGTEADVQFGTGDQWAQLSAYGWVSSNVNGDLSPRWYNTSNVNSNGDWMPKGAQFNVHMHVIDPCVTQRTC